MIELRRLADDPETGDLRAIPLGRLQLTDEGTVAMVGVEPRLADFLLDFAVTDGERRYTITDGAEWLRWLTSASLGWATWASEVSDPERAAQLRLAVS
jgi:hypothetical protein